MEIKDVEKLAQLARIELPENEKEALLHDMQSILGYIDQIAEVDATHVDLTLPDHRNILREDGKPNETGAYTDDILKIAPDTQDGFIKVKQIL